MPKKRQRSRKAKASAPPPQRFLGALMSSFGDNEPTRNKKEITVKIWDWIKYDYPADITANNRIKSYALDLTQNFFAPAQSLANVNETKNRIKSVCLEALSPFEPITFNGGAARTGLPLVLAACPVLADDTDSGSSLVGQSSTAVHVDQRQAWIKVAHWNWDSIFANTQLQPVYPPGAPESVELFRYSVVDSVSGNPIVEVIEQGNDLGLTLRVCIEIACPVTLVPNPVKYDGEADVFAGAGFIGSFTVNQTPVQYELMRMGDAF